MDASEVYLPASLDYQAIAFQEQLNSSQNSFMTNAIFSKRAKSMFGPSPHFLSSHS